MAIYISKDEQKTLTDSTVLPNGRYLCEILNFAEGLSDSVESLVFALRILENNEYFNQERKIYFALNGADKTKILINKKKISKFLNNYNLFMDNIDEFQKTQKYLIGKRIVLDVSENTNKKTLKSYKNYDVIPEPVEEELDVSGIQLKQPQAVPNLVNTQGYTPQPNAQIQQTQGATSWDSHVLNNIQGYTPQPNVKITQAQETTSWDAATFENIVNIDDDEFEAD